MKNLIKFIGLGFLIVSCIFHSCKKEKVPIDYTGQIGTVNDTDGNTYPTIGIGSQIWMAENLKTTRYNDGTSIPNVTNVAEWTNLSTPGYCWYHNDEATYKNTYGALYNWYTVNTGKLCPSGWHVPNYLDWDTLILKLDKGAPIYAEAKSIIAANKLNETGTTHWVTYNSNPPNGGNDESGFTALPGGCRSTYYQGTFCWIGEKAYWWSAGDYVSYILDFMGCVYGSPTDKNDGLSVRCLKD